MQEFDNIDVATAQGPVRGIVNRDGSTVFKGIPFAEPPVGALRFKRSVPHRSWIDPLDCTEYRACSMQYVGPVPSIVGTLPGGLAESCLHLNLWTPPTTETDTPLPVIVWVHGGGYLRGSGSEPLYEGSHVAADGVIVVSVNYRLGAFGLMWTDDGDPNCALWDLVRALEWVQQNISAFGGDPRNVTVAGESAGAGCVTCLVASPIANTLFQRAVIMSTVAHTTDDERTAKLRARQFAASLGATTISTHDLRSYDVDTIVRAQTGLLDNAPDQDIVVAHSTPGWQGPPPDQLRSGYSPAEPDGTHYVIPGTERRDAFAHAFFPVCDGELLPGHPLDLIAAGAGAHITMIIGSNREETAFRENPTDPRITAPLTYGARVETLTDAVERATWFLMGFGRLEQMGGSTRVAERLVDSYAAAEGDGGGAAPAGSPQHVWNRLASDMSFNASTVMVAARRVQTNATQTFVYRFDGFNKRNAFHGWELGLLFGTLLDASKPDVKALADSIRSSFTNFAKFGDPNGPDTLQIWQPWTSTGGTNGGTDAVMHFDRSGNHLGRYSDAAPAIAEVVEMLDVAYPHHSRTNGFTTIRSTAAQPAP